MIRMGTREWTVPLWLWAAVPLAFMLYVGLDIGLSSRPTLINLQGPDVRYLSFFKQLTIASVAGFLLIDLARRSRMPWYGVPLVLLASIAGMAFVANSIGNSLEATSRFAVGLAITAAGSRASADGLGIALWGGMAAAVFVLAASAALVITLASRPIAGLPLLTRDVFRDFWVNLAGAFLWIAVAIGGYLAIRFGFRLGHGYPASAVPRWLPFASACIAALVATALHLGLAYRRQRRESAAPGAVRLWLLLIVCIAAFMYKPDILGWNTFRAYHDYVRPALRAVHLLPTPALVVGGYKIDVPFHDTQILRNGELADGSSAWISVKLPPEYGLVSAKYPASRPSVMIFRRDITLQHTSQHWLSRRKALDDAQAKQPGEDAVVQADSPTWRSLVLRMAEFPGVDFQLGSFGAEHDWEAAAQALRRFVRERVKPVGPALRAP